MYEKTIITQTMEMARQRSEELRERKEASNGSPFLPVSIAILFVPRR
jgi:hypothetical protein